MGCGNSTSAAPGSSQDKDKKSPSNLLTMGLAVASGGMTVDNMDMETSVGLETELDQDFAADYSYVQLT